MNKYWHSLRFGYTVSVAILIILVFSGAYLAYHTINQARTETSAQLKVNQQLSDDARQIRISVLDSYTYIDAYLLEPGHKEYKQHALNFIYFVGAANLGESWTYQGNLLIQLVINVTREYKHVPAKYISF